MSPLTVGARQKIVADMGLSALPLFSLLVILLVGSGMVYKEIDKRTIMTLLSKPVSRLEYVLGKYAGLAATLIVMLASMSVLFIAACWLTGTPLRVGYLAAGALTIVEMLVVTAIVMFFSSFSTPVLTSLFTLGAFLVGHLIADLQRFAQVTGNPAIERMLGVVKYILPNLDLFNVRNAAVHELPIGSDHLLWATVYGLVYAALLLLLGGQLFRRREFK
jgi:ABC-type transport system involved in multi-copper enzyme maturation permease subunit